MALYTVSCKNQSQREMIHCIPITIVLVEVFHG